MAIFFPVVLCKLKLMKTLPPESTIMEGVDCCLTLLLYGAYHFFVLAAIGLSGVMMSLNSVNRERHKHEDKKVEVKPQSTKTVCFYKGRGSF